MNNYEIITKLYKDKYFNNLFIYQNDKSYNDDFKQEIFEYLLKVEPIKIIQLNERNELYAYVHQIIKNNQHISGRFYQKVLKSNKLITYSNEIQNKDIQNEDTNIIQRDYLILKHYILQKKILSYIETELFIYYYNLGDSFLDEICNKKSYRAIADCLEINYTTIKKIIDKIKYKIINCLKNDNDYNQLLSDEYIKKILKI